MAEPMYFQWQNEFLVGTIYPSRERKLRDFLIYCKEIDLWAEYKDKNIADLDKEKQEYFAQREVALITAYKSYKTEYAYFTRDDVRMPYMAKYKLTDETQLAKIKALHTLLMTYLPKYADVRKEKYFVTQQLVLWEQYLKTLSQSIIQKQRRVNIVVPEKRSAEQQDLQKLQLAFAIANDEHDRLTRFVSTYNNIEKRKLEYYKARQAADTGKKGALSKLDDLHRRLEPVQVKQRQIASDLARLKTPPTVDSVTGYFTTPDISDQIHKQFPQVDPALLNAIASLHKQMVAEMSALKDQAVRLITARNYAYKWQEQRNAFQKEADALEAQLSTAPADWSQRAGKQARLDMLRNAGLPALEMELGKLGDYLTAFDYTAKPPAEWQQMIQAKEKEMLGVQQASAQLQKDAADLQQQLRGMDSVLNQSEEEYFVRFPPGQPITVKDIVRGKVEAYAASLKDKNQFELLEMIIQRFVEKPDQYPLWLQYMVIHFSGMRYATAHGSWADPKDLLLSLRTSALEKEFKKLDDDAIEAIAQERIALYEATGSPAPAGSPDVPGAADPNFRAKVAPHLRGLKSPSPYYRRSALYELRFDEEKYEVQNMSPSDALEELQAMNAKDPFPEWMWKEIVKLTDLRVNEVKDPNWENLTPEEQDEKNDARYAEYRLIMNKWKQDNLTGWREEHDRTDQLIVTRSVCNEVAEQVQHLRGNTPPGGLAAKPLWYMHMEDDALKAGKASDPQRPYFVKVKSGVQNNYKVGASILWLRFVNEFPNPWRIAQPLATKEGDGLIPPAYLKKTADDDWVYSQSDCVMRTRLRTDPVTKKTTRDQQWLRWMHEATVAKISENADGPIVLTFETARPFDDPSTSAVGIVKHDLDDLAWDGGEEYYYGSFIGYSPEGQVPFSHLEDMLDWNHILLKDFMTPAQLDDYRKKYFR